MKASYFRPKSKILASLDSNVYQPNLYLDVVQITESTRTRSRPRLLTPSDYSHWNLFALLPQSPGSSFSSFLHQC
ncbi:hypothetical protein M413DRAFT_449954 [Hebeloma cylindrosporum]|uniref:Uncharacterized protein n=1 Tax=Hebeloma cylindrosporum TaxID=76867 RepID=A0A0C3BUE4_HEBCY|nr:hypothetical protein M413DRAFT_449954 [Hebeloma cylindrosporum h7]